MNFKQLITSINVYHEKENPIFGETVTKITLDDESGGIYFTLTQYPDQGEQIVKFDFKEWLKICESVKVLEKEALGVEENC